MNIPDLEISTAFSIFTVMIRRQLNSLSIRNHIVLRHSIYIPSPFSDLFLTLPFMETYKCFSSGPTLWGSKEILYLILGFLNIGDISRCARVQKSQSGHCLDLLWKNQNGLGNLTRLLDLEKRSSSQVGQHTCVQ